MEKLRFITAHCYTIPQFFKNISPRFLRTTNWEVLCSVRRIYRRGRQRTLMPAGMPALI